MTGCVKRRSTFTTTVLSCLSLTTTPCKTRFGIFVSLTLGRSELLLLQRAHARDVLADHTHPRRILQLAGGALEAQIELLLLERQQLVLQLIRRHGLEIGHSLGRLHDPHSAMRWMKRVLMGSLAAP